MGNTILNYPKRFYELLKIFKLEFTKPQFKNFCQITNGIVLSQYSTITRFSKMFENRDNSSLNKFLTQSPWDENKVKNKMQKSIFKLIPDLNVFVGDDTLSEKPFAKVMEGVASHYSGLKKKHCNGHSIVTSGFYHKGDLIPFDYKIYLRKETANKLNMPFLTKNDTMCNFIAEASKLHNFEYAVFDSWYSNKYVIGEIIRLKKKFVTEIKSNRNITINKRKREVRNHCKDIQISEYTYTSINKNIFRFYERDGFISKIGTVRLIHCQMLIKEENKSVWSDINHIISNDLFSSSEFLIKTYLKRNSIEPFHREAKQQLGLDKYQLRNYRGIERYLFLVLLVYVLLMLLNNSLMEEENRRTLGELRIFLREDCYTILLRKVKIMNLEDRSLVIRNIAYSF